MKRLIFIGWVIGSAFLNSLYAQEIPEPELDQWLEHSTFRPAHSDSILGTYTSSTGYVGGEIRLFANGIFRSDSSSDVRSSNPTYKDYAKRWGYYILKADTVLFKTVGLYSGTPFSCQAAEANIKIEPSQWKRLLKKDSDQIYLVDTDFKVQRKLATMALKEDSRIDQFLRLTSRGAGPLSPTGGARCNAQFGLEMKVDLKGYEHQEGAQDMILIEGRIVDSHTGEVVQGVEVMGLAGTGFTRTDENGYFQVRSAYTAEHKIIQLTFHKAGYIEMRVQGPFPSLFEAIK